MAVESATVANRHFISRYRVSFAKLCEVYIYLENHEIKHKKSW
jgi:hypothetical protein